MIKRIMSEEERKCRSENAKRKGFGKWMKGKHLSEETKKKISEMHKGHLVSEETKKKIGNANRGKFHTEESKRKLSVSLKGRIPWNKGKKYPQFSGINSPLYNRKHTKEEKEKIRQALLEQYKNGRKSPMLGKHHAKESNLKVSLANKGKHYSLKTEFKKGQNIGKKYTWIGKGNLSTNWKGGKTQLNRLLRNGSEWKIWRELVFLRDNFTCQNKNCSYCHNKLGVKIHPHHIKPLALYPELVFNINNGITYCANFHLKSKLHRNMIKEYNDCN